MARRNKKKAAEHENNERWLITYADLITLLLIFFVIMYSMSKIDVAKYEVIAQVLNFTFQKADSPIPAGQGVVGGANLAKFKENGDKSRSDKMQEDLAEKEKRFADTLEKIQEYIQQNNLETQISATNTPRGIAVTLNDLFLFDLGRADLKQASYPILNKLASLFPTLNTTISIEGHTDNLPLSTGSVYKDNWGLSNERSLSVLRYFIYNAKLDPKKFVSTGYGDTRPVVDNDTPENRAKNRRVEIVLLREG
ncbi:flagellar motor protein [Paenibacillus thalictri]|uniref:Flagellar motor protein n=1 Tax=Paenibacillus thalictri TaxID=2527873 RepID=A0A4V2J3K4_9BACL|nr:flagellar motor protein [Paenibacillus thalictri]